MKAVVMAGGEGSRLRPLTSNRPKPLVPVVNRPIMGHILSQLALHGFKEVVATLHYLPDEIQNALGDGSEHGVCMTYSIEDVPLGTAGSVKQAEALIKDDTFLIVSGDALTDCHLSKALEFHKSRQSLATIVLSRVPNPLEFGIVITDDSGRIERFLEKPGWGEVFSDTVNTGIYILEPEILDKMESNLRYDWSGDIFPALLAEQAPMYGYVSDEYWCDVGTIQQYMEAQKQVLSGQTNLKPSGTEIAPGVWVGEGTVIDDSALLVPPVCIGSNSRIKRRAQVGPYTALGDSTLVEEGAVIERSVVWDSCYIGLDAAVRSAAVCSRVTIKRDSKVMEDAVVGDRCLIDVGATIRPRVKVWPDKSVERGSTLTMSLVWGNKWRGSLFRDLGVAGLSNIEITPEFATRFGLALGTVLPQHTRVVASRDSSRSSQMIKSSIMASLLSTGCDVIDLRAVPVPIARHFTLRSDARAAVNVRKLPGNARLTLMETFDETGMYVSQPFERKVEATFFREDFQRIDSEELGKTEVATGANALYKGDFFKLLPQSKLSRRPEVVVDYGFSPISSIFQGILHELGVTAMSFNSHSDARLAPRTPEAISRHLEELGRIVGSLNCELGALVTSEGERLYVVDDRGRPLMGNTLFAVFCLLVAKTRPATTIAMSVTAPSRIEEILVREGARVRRCRSSARDLILTAGQDDVGFAGDESGGFIDPRLHPGFDAMFSLASLMSMLDQTNTRLSELVDSLPDFHLAYEQVPCPWETKGAVMRRLSEEHRQGQRVELVDGIKVYDDDAWVLVLPDSFEPVFHVFAESPDQGASTGLVAEYAGRIRELGASH
ncbi:MAG: NTP transferase domain-containing protein [Fimbriimonadaceae bacterium]|nr:NTP transferase domain-containing protein [Fimbriimonadaceae bacterium]QYK58192.1 MAG: NTP transferase domain-containing protein [Fimbriimonadaceae bacterium]